MMATSTVWEVMTVATTGLGITELLTLITHGHQEQTIRGESADFQMWWIMSRAEFIFLEAMLVAAELKFTIILQAATALLKSGKLLNQTFTL